MAHLSESRGSYLHKQNSKLEKKAFYFVIVPTDSALQFEGFSVESKAFLGLFPEMNQIHCLSMCYHYEDLNRFIVIG